MIREEVVREVVIEYVRKLAEQCFDWEDYAGQILQTEINRQSGNWERQITIKLQQLENFLKQLYADRVAGILETEDFKQMYKEKKEEKSQLERQLTDCRKAEKQWTPQELVRCFWKNAETEKGFWSLIIEHIEVTPEQTIQIDFRFSRPSFCS